MSNTFYVGTTCNIWGLGYFVWMYSWLQSHQKTQKNLSIRYSRKLPQLVAWQTGWPLSTGCPTGTSSFKTEHERFKHQYLWAAETLCHTERRLAFSCKANHKVTFSSKKNEQNQIFHYHKVTKEIKTQSRPSLVVQWLRICLLIQGTQTKIPHASGQLSPCAATQTQCSHGEGGLK